MTTCQHNAIQGNTDGSYQCGQCGIMLVRTERKCWGCDGHGKVDTAAQPDDEHLVPCPECHGSGIQEEFAPAELGDVMLYCNEKDENRGPLLFKCAPGCKHQSV